MSLISTSQLTNSTKKMNAITSNVNHVVLNTQSCAFYTNEKKNKYERKGKYIVAKAYFF